MLLRNLKCNMKLSQLKQIIKEEIKDSLNEAGNIESKVADLYGYAEGVCSLPG